MTDVPEEHTEPGGSRRPWLGALEGYYGPPLSRAARRRVVEWVAAHGYDAYVYSPKDDPYHRRSWREPYPAPAMAELEALVVDCQEQGIAAGLTVSPGLDWRRGDAGELDHLTAKVEQLLDAGATCIGVQWDDVPGGGADVGAEHGRAVATVHQRLARPGLRWLACPVDYAVDTPTEYLRAFAGELADEIALVWTGPSVVTRQLTAGHVEHLAGELGTRLVFAENYPVNDLGMTGVLHLGPYPERDPGAMSLVDGALVNFMSLPLASRVGLALAARAWHDTHADREAAWAEAIADVPGLEPLARACRSWLDAPGPDPLLDEWARAAGADDRRLRSFLAAGCRAGLEDDLAAEVEAWLAAWEREAGVMSLALDVLEAAEPPTIQQAAALGLAWQQARGAQHQAFGTRFAIYPATRHDGEHLRAAQGAVTECENLTDRLVRRALRRLT